MENSLSAQSRVWIFQADRTLSDYESSTITDKVNAFVQQWTAHKLGVKGAGYLLYNRFIILMADEEEVAVSGCSIESSVHFIHTIAREFELEFFDRWNFAYQNGNAVESCGREKFQQLVEQGIINNQTIVFNNLVKTKAEFESKWRIEYKDSWHKNLNAAPLPFDSL